MGFQVFDETAVNMGRITLAISVTAKCIITVIHALVTRPYKVPRQVIENIIENV